MIWNLIDKPEKCQDTDCNNKAYSKNYLMPERYYWVCRKHHRQYNLGIS